MQCVHELAFVVGRMVCELLCLLQYDVQAGCQGPFVMVTASKPQPMTDAEEVVVRGAILPYGAAPPPPPTRAPSVFGIPVINPISLGTAVLLPNGGIKVTLDGAAFNQWTHAFSTVGGAVGAFNFVPSRATPNFTSSYDAST